MIRPRWQGLNRSVGARGWRRWDQVIAVIAAAKLGWVIFDVSYVPLRHFWLQRNLYPVPSFSLVVPLPWLPDLTPLYDPVKGIRPHQDTQTYLDQFHAMDRVIVNDGLSAANAKEMLENQRTLTDLLIETNPFLSSGHAGTLEKLKNRLRSRAQMESAQDAAALLLSQPYLERTSWDVERQFWLKQIIPLVEINYWRLSLIHI